MSRLNALLDQLAALARDVGHLRRRLDRESSAWHLADRIADELQTVDAIVYPAAAELAREFFAISGDEELAVSEALRAVDDRARLLRTLLRLEGQS
jgi:hypothetical protein